MEKITVNTGLENFILIDRITDINDNEIHGTVQLYDTPISRGIESLAQLGALHVRWLYNFDRHAALIIINNLKFTTRQNLNDTLSLYGNMESHSDRAFYYNIKALQGNKVQLEGSFLFAAIDYDSFFKREILQQHYQKVFSCLRENSKQH